MQVSIYDNNLKKMSAGMTEDMTDTMSDKPFNRNKWKDFIPDMF